MAQTAMETVTEVLNGQRGQSVLLPDDFRFSKDHVYLRRDLTTGVVSISEKPFRPSLQDVFDAIDAARDEDFELDRDMSLPVERELF